jgi:hypothetical protein
VPGLYLRESACYLGEHLVEPGSPSGQPIIVYSLGRGHRVFFEIQHTLKSITRWLPSWSRHAEQDHTLRLLY